MLIRIKDNFWIDFEEVRLIIAAENEGLKVFYKGQPDFTIIPNELKDEFLQSCSQWTGFPLCGEENEANRNKVID